MADSWPLLDLDDLARRVDSGSILNRDTVRDLIADCRRKLAALATAERARDHAQAALRGALDERDTARRVIDGGRAQAAAALGLADDADGGPLLGEAIRQLVAERDAANAQAASLAVRLGQEQAEQQQTRSDAAATAVELGFAREESEHARRTALALLAENFVLTAALADDEITLARAAKAGERPPPNPWEQVAQLRAALERIRDQKRATPEENCAWSDAEPEVSCCPECDAVEIACAALAATDPAGAGQ